MTPPRRHAGSAARACELRRKRSTPWPLAVAAVALLSVPAFAMQTAEPHQPAAPIAQASGGQAEHAGAAAEHGGLAGLLWPTANFLILIGGVYYFLRTPFSEHLQGRSTQIRKDLVEAAELNKTATSQLADVDRKLQALPGELEALKKRGLEEIAAEEQRIASAAEADRARLLTQTKREIDVRLQTAQRELTDHAASLALKLATQRLSKDMTPADQTRLVDRYVHHVKGS